MIQISTLQQQFPDLTKVKGNKGSIRSLNELARAQSEEATFFVDERFRSLLSASKAGVLITDSHTYSYVLEEFEGTIWHTSHPLGVLNTIGQLLESELFGEDEVWSESGTHHTAIVEEGCEIHPTATVGPYCVVRRSAVIGEKVNLLAYVYVGVGARIHERCVLGAHASILAHSVIGKGSRVMPGAVIGSKGFKVLRDAKGQNVVLPQLGRTVIGASARIGCNTSIDRAAFNETRVGDRACLDNLVQIGHNVKVGDDLIMCAHGGLAGSSKLGHRVTIASFAGVKDHVELTDDVTIAALSAAMKHVKKPNLVLKGQMAKPLADFLRQESALRNLPKLVRHIKALEQRIKELEKKVTL